MSNATTKGGCAPHLGRLWAASLPCGFEALEFATGPQVGALGSSKA
jgi:hypothetical protein